MIMLLLSFRNDGTFGSLVPGVIIGNGKRG
jgi:hypothetical protein